MLISSQCRSLVAFVTLVTSFDLLGCGSKGINTQDLMGNMICAMISRMIHLGSFPVSVLDILWNPMSLKKTWCLAMSCCKISLAVRAVSSRTFELKMPESVVGDRCILVAVAIVDAVRNFVPVYTVRGAVDLEVNNSEGRGMDFNDESKL
jgi:hypothetical protein